MLELNDLEIEGYERVVEAKDQTSGLHAFIAIHDTTLGPALGGTRIYPYANAEDALEDALRLSRGMTYKSAIAEIGLGGGKSVIIADADRDKTAQLFNSFAELMNRLDGTYICAEDVGTTVEDIAQIGEKTRYVCAMESDQSSGDPSPYTAWGVYRGMQAVALRLWNTTTLQGKRIAISGLGKVGSELAEFLFWHRARLIVADIDTERAEQISRLYDAECVDPAEIHACDCDIFAPCALGGILNDQTIPQLRCAAIAGAANNQLLHPQDGEALRQAGILYAPDYVINAGGIINAAAEFDPEGYSPRNVLRRVYRIFDTLIDIFNRSEAEMAATNTVARHLALHKIHYGIGQRKEPLRFHGAIAS